MSIHLSFGLVRNLAIAGAAGLVGFHALQEHSLEMGLTDTLNQVGLGSVASFLTPKPAYGAPLPTASGQTQVVGPYGSGSTVSSAGSCTGGGDINAMIAANPQFLSEMQAWQNTIWKVYQTASPTGPADWGSFRSYLLAFGYPDPGAIPPNSFCQ